MKANNNKYPEVLTEKESKRFWDKVDKNGPWSLIKYIRGRCWIWTTGLNKNGYGQFSLRRKNPRAHRLAYVISKGQIAEDLALDHLCRNRACVNPDHLEIVTHKENTLRGLGPTIVGNLQKEKVQCPLGHSLKSPNLVRSRLKDGRVCLACNRTKSKYNNAKYRKGIIIDPNLFQQVADEYYKEILQIKDSRCTN